MIRIRPAQKDDAKHILRLIKGLAEYEKLSHEVSSDISLIEKNLFGEDRAAEVILAEYQSEVVGFALFITNFSTFLGKPGIYLEDLFVEPDVRGKGIGLALFKEVAQLAHQRGCGRMEWSVLDWNQPAIDFYKKFGAKPMDEWTVFRLTEGDLSRIVDA